MRYQAALRPDCCTNTADKRNFKGYISYKFLINLVFSVIKDHMIIDCPNCNKKFVIDKKLIPENGRNLKCSSCDHIWHYKIPITESVDDLEISEDKNTNLDINNSEIEKKEDKHKKEINAENLTDINQGVLSKDSTEGEEDEENDEDETKDELKSDENHRKIKMLLVYITVVIIFLLGLIFLFDTFKFYLFSMFPSITPLFDSFYETLLDFKLFIKDLTN